MHRRAHEPGAPQKQSLAPKCARLHPQRVHFFYFVDRIKVRVQSWGL